MRRDKEPSELFRNRRELLNGGLSRQVGLEPVKVESECLCAADEGWMLRSEDHSIHDAAGDLDPVDRFNAGRAVGEETDAAGRCDRGDGRVALPLVPDLELVASIGGKDSARPGEVCGGAMGLFLKEPHQCRSGLDCGVGVVGDLQRDQEVGKAHDAQPDLPRAFRHAVDVGKGETVAIDGVVEEAHGEGNGFGQSGEVDGWLYRCARDEVRDIDRAEGTGLIGQ